MKLVLLHPLPLDGSIWPASVTTLVDDCLAPDLYSFGDDIEEWARAVLDLAGPGPMALVGNSVGGSCAIEIARLAPDDIKALVLVGAKAGHNPDPALRDEALRMLDEAGIDAAWGRYWKPLFGPGTDQAIIHRAQDVARSQGVRAIANGITAFHGRPDRDGFLDTWQRPVWVVTGEHDIRPDRARSSAGRLRHGQFQMVPGSGHYVPLEAPDQLRRIVAAAIHEGHAAA